MVNCWAINSERRSKANSVPTPVDPRRRLRSATQAVSGTGSQVSSRTGGFDLSIPFASPGGARWAVGAAGREADGSPHAAGSQARNWRLANSVAGHEFAHVEGGEWLHYAGRQQVGPMCSVPEAPGAITTVPARAAHRPPRRENACIGCTSARDHLPQSRPTPSPASAPGRRSADTPARETFVRCVARACAIPGHRPLSATRR